MGDKRRRLQALLIQCRDGKNLRRKMSPRHYQQLCKPSISQEVSGKGIRAEPAVHSDTIADQPHWLVRKAAPACHHGSLRLRIGPQCQRLKRPSLNLAVHEPARARENLESQVGWTMTGHSVAHSAVTHSRINLIGVAMKNPYTSTSEAGHAHHMEALCCQQ